MSRDYEKLADVLEGQPPPLNTAARLSVHEKICSYRWKGTLARLARIETTLISSAGAIILLLLGIVLKAH